MVRTKGPSETQLEHAMRHALELACEVEGRTAPNPPVGAVALDVQGQVLGGAAHQGAGLPHAEAGLIAKLGASGKLAALHTMVVTLEPCSHFGRTPPCAQALIDVDAKQVLYGTKDPTREAAGGHAALTAAGIKVRGGFLSQECDQLNAPFAKHATTGQPWIVVKRAFRPDDSNGWTMTPDIGDKTFTRPQSLIRAHEIRRSCDGLITGSGTVLADDPSFTVRHVQDHPKFMTGEAKRPLIVLDRRQRISSRWTDKIGYHFELHHASSLQGAITKLGKLGCMKVMIEAGPVLSTHILNANLCDELVDFYRHDSEDEERTSYRADLPQ